MDFLIFLPTTNGLDIPDIHNLKIQTEWTGMQLLAQAALEGMKITKTFVIITTATATAIAVPLEVKLIEIIITWVMTQVILVTILYRPTAHLDLAVLSPRIRIPSHPQQGVRIGVIDVIDHIGMTVVMNLELMTGIIINDGILSREVVETPLTLRVQKMMTIQDDHLAEITGAEHVLTQGQHAKGRVLQEHAMELRKSLILGIPRMNMLRRTTKTTPARMGHAREQLPDIKNIRVSPPEKYAGDDDIEKFDTWLVGLLRWYRVYNVTGNKKDSMRVDLCGTAITGLAATWYVDEVEAWNRKTRDWYFEDLICAMYKQFIHEVTAQNATNSYKRTKFSRSKGALAFFNDLQHHASRMVQTPDEYSMKRKFLKGLPDDLVENLLKLRRVSAEHTSLSKLLNERSERSNVPKSTGSTSTPQPNTSNNRTSRSNQEATSVRSQPKANYCPGGSGGHNAPKPKARQSTPRPHNPNYKLKNDSSGKKPIPLDQVELFAAQVIDEDKESPSVEADEDQEQHSVPEESTVEDNRDNSDPQGSQYESDQDDYTLNEYEEYIEVEEDEDEDADIVYIRTTRASTNEELVKDVADTSSVSNSTSTTVESTNTSIELTDIPSDMTDIPSDMTPNELLLTLSENTQIEIYLHHKTQEEPNWTPPKITIDIKRCKYYSKVGSKLLRMGYTYNEEEIDSEWIQSLTVRDPIEFQELTGYWVPTQVRCESCGECTPDIREMIVRGEDGEIYTRSIIRCNNDSTKVIIRAMTEAPEPTRAYCSSMHRPIGTMTYALPHM
ncbi:hypothetical protein PILCRDRAFT_15579 [Piloderma croceum F 1598]|uniref:Uncharacterized protein n=1 Tax=Piloderma croceum (strain F 1598) TaxID=765440 RepID=A0A0C3EK74_PILCF|nr:hypothetical protein PILCRDRAFT_15579 [Piloderma croceum F 1598]